MINFFRLFAILLRNVELTYLEGGITDTEGFGNDDYNIIKRTSFSKRAGMNVFG